MMKECFGLGVARAMIQDSSLVCGLIKIDFTESRSLCAEKGKGDDAGNRPPKNGYRLRDDNANIVDQLLSSV